MYKHLFSSIFAVTLTPFDGVFGIGDDLADNSIGLSHRKVRFKSPESPAPSSNEKKVSTFHFINFIFHQKKKKIGEAEKWWLTGERGPAITRPTNGEI